MKNTWCFLLVIVCQRQYAQMDSLIKAQELCNQKQFDKVLPLINKVVLNQETKDDASAWHIRAFVYSKKYDQTGKNNTSTTYLLDSTISSAVRSNKLDKDNEFRAFNNEFIKNCSAKFKKMSNILAQDSLNFYKSEFFYKKYVKATLIINPAFQTKESDIEYYGAVGTIFADLFNTSGYNAKYGDIAKLALLKVLEIDNKNISANINLGILYYNQGVAMVKQSEYDIDLSQLDILQENAKKLFKQSLPFMIKVYELDPKDVQALEGLQGIYNALLDKENEEIIKQKREALKQQSK